MAGTDIYVVVSLSILSVLIVLLNSCVCLLVYLKRALRTTTNWLIVSLAVSDILTGGVLLPVFLIKPTSVVTSYLICIILLSGVDNLCAVTYERYVAVIKPLEYPFRAPKILKRALLLSWLLPAIYSLLPLFWDTNPALTIHKAYMVCLQFFGVVVPYIFIIFAYVRIFKRVRRSLATKKDLKSFRVHRNNRKQISSDAKVAKVFSIVASAFLLCWLPIMYITTAKIINRIDVIPSALPVVSLFTVATGSLVNPLMYAFLKPDFKMAIRNCFTKGALSDTALTMHSTEGQERSRQMAGRGNSPKENENFIRDTFQCSLDCKL